MTKAKCLAPTWAERGNIPIPGENIAERSSDQKADCDTERAKGRFLVHCASLISGHVDKVAPF